jgi:hypothetical protein
MTVSDAMDSVDDSFKRSMLTNGFFGIDRAAGVKSTGRRQNWRDDFSIGQNQKGQKIAAHLRNFEKCVFAGF